MITLLLGITVEEEIRLELPTCGELDSEAVGVEVNEGLAVAWGGIMAVVVTFASVVVIPPIRFIVVCIMFSEV